MWNKLASPNGENYKRIKQVFNKIKHIYLEDVSFCTTIKEQYQAGKTKKELVDQYMPLELEEGKSKDIAIMIIDEILKELPKQKREEIARERQIANLLLQNSEKQSARAKRWWIKKKLSSEDAKVMSKNGILWDQEKELIYQRYQEMREKNREEKLNTIKKDIAYLFEVELTLGVIRGIIQRKSKEKQRGLSHPDVLRRHILEIWENRGVNPTLKGKNKEYNLQQKTLGKIYEKISDYLLTEHNIEKSPRAIEGIIKRENAQKKKKTQK